MNTKPKDKGPTLGNSILSKRNDTETELRLLSNLPTITTEKEYDEVPVEEFGKALLRGMGWKSDNEENEGSSTNKKPVPPHEMKFHPDGLGIGAKVSAMNNDNTKTSNRKRRSDQEIFMPIVRIDRKTGERIE